MTTSTTSNSKDLMDGIVPGVTRMEDVDGFVGTIVYLGPVASAKDPNEMYAGVVWDDASRGKHDGSVVCRRTNQLVRHFSCPPSNPCGASFVRLKKLNLGVDLTPAVMREKYVTAEDQLVAPNNILPHTARTSGGREKPIEFYGELQIRSRQQLEDLDSISLRRMAIARFSASSTALFSLREFDHLTGMDLAGNLLSDWDTVLRIMKELPHLTTLSVAANRIRDPPPDLLARVLNKDDHSEDNDGISCHQAPFSSLQLLNLNQCGIASVQTLLWIGTLVPQLQNLCIAHADLSALDDDFCRQVAAQFPQLQQLDITNCGLTSWNRQIVPLCSTLRCLEDLIMDDNAIDTTNYNNGVVPAVYFPQLKSLQLTGTQISTWIDLDGLSLFPRLASLRLRRCPLVSSLGTGEARAVAVARISGLTKFNASNITPKERIEAERRYVSSVACQLLQLPPDSSASATANEKEVPSDRKEFLKGHVAFSRLMEKHRDAIASTMDVSSSSPTATADVSWSEAGSSNKLGLVVVNVTIQSMAPSSCHKEPLVRRLPGSLPTKRLKAVCARSFGLDPDLQRLSFRTHSDGFPIEMDDEEHTLAYYGVSDGATIFMNEIDVEEVQREKEKLKQQQFAKMEEQEALEMQKQRHKRDRMGAPVKSEESAIKEETMTDKSEDPGAKALAVKPKESEEHVAKTLVVKRKESDAKQESSLALKSILGHDDNSHNNGDRLSWFFNTLWQEQCAEFRWKNRQSLREDTMDNSMSFVHSNHWNDAAIKQSPYEEIVAQGWNALVQLLGAAGGVEPTDHKEEHVTPLVFKEQSSVPVEDYNNNLFAAYLDGCSIVLNHADWSSPWIAALCLDLQKTFPHAFANVYITPPGSQAVRAHADDRDVFVIQVAGQKSWKVYKKIPIPHPYPNEQVGKEGLEVPQSVLDGPTLIETTLCPGDVLYMPRGYVHEARANDESFSFHVTIALATHDWTLAGIMSNATAKILHNVVENRKAINLGIGMKELENVAKADREELQKQLQETFRLLQEEITVESISNHQGDKFRRHNRRAFPARMKVMHEMRFPRDHPSGSPNPIVGIIAASKVTLDSLIRAATQEEKESVMMDQPRGLRVREEVADGIIAILQALKTAAPVESNGYIAVKDLKSLLNDRAGPGPDEGADLICELTLLSFVKVCVEQGALALSPKTLKSF